MMADLRVGVVGVGHLGRHHARVLAGIDGVSLAGVADSRIEQARMVAEPLGSPAFADYRELLDRVDAVSIAVPTRFHREVAGAFLERGIPAMVEKPLAADLAEAEALVELAEANGVVLQVGHIERFNPILHALADVEFRPRYIQAERMGTYTFRSTDIGVVHDLMIHDLDLLCAIVPAAVASVSAVGMTVFGGLEDVANARIEFEDGTVADISASRASYQPSRKMRLWGQDGYVGVDFAAKTATVVSPSDRLRAGQLDAEGLDLADGAAVRSHLFGKVLRVDQIEAQGREPLALELEEFVSAVLDGRRPTVTGHDVLKPLRLADRIVKSLQAHQWDATAPERTAPQVVSPGHATPPRPKLLTAAPAEKPVSRVKS